MSQLKHLIVIDLGSNSFHMVIAREQKGCIQVVNTQKERVQLGLGLDKNNYLSEEAMKRGVACLARFADGFAYSEENIVRVVATHTLRKAINRDMFISQAFKVFQYPIEVIDGKTEAELIYQGVAHTHPIRGNTLVIDIGGGSTEVIIGCNFDPRLCHSFEIGSGIARTTCFDDGVINEEKMAEAREWTRRLMTPVLNEFNQLGYTSAVGTSGSIKVICQAMLELHGDEEITVERLKQLHDNLILWGHFKKIPLDSLDQQRLPQLAGAVAILTVFFELMLVDKMAYSAGSLREGVLYGLSSSSQEFDPKHRTIINLSELHGVDHGYARRVVKQLQCFYDGLSEHGWFLTNKEQLYLNSAASLHEIGLIINSKKHANHGAYIIENSVTPGFNATEQKIMALLVKNHRGKIDANFDDIGMGVPKMHVMIQLLRLAVLLTRGRVDNSPTMAVDIFYEQSRLIIVIGAEYADDIDFMDALSVEVKVQSKVGLGLRIDTNLVTPGKEEP